MARFDVYRLGKALVVACQADLHDQLPTRFVIPLQPAMAQYPAKQSLNPYILIDDEAFVLATEHASAVRASLLGKPIGSAREYRDEIVRALDFLITGF